MGWDRRRKLSRREFFARAGALAIGAGIAATLGRRLVPARALQPSNDPPIIQVLSEEIADPSPTLFTAQVDGTAVYTSGVIEASFAFTHVALHWPPQEPASSFALRTSADALDWSPWHSLGVEAHAEENPRGEVYSTLIGADRHRYVQYRATTTEGRLAARATVAVLNSIDGPRLPRPKPLAAAEAPSSSTQATSEQFPFTMVAREDWGADESLRFEDGKETWKPMFVPAKKAVVHHTATENGYSDPAAWVRSVYTYHAKNMGWGDIGYNALIGNDGRVYEGRYGREGAQYDPVRVREVLSAGAVAGHATVHNYGTVGVALIGDFRTFSLPANMYETLLAYLEYECRRHNIQPTVVSDFLQSSGEWSHAIANVPGHRDVGQTDCPGDRVYALLPEIRAALEERLANASAPVVEAIIKMGGAELGDVDLTFRWSGTDDATPQNELAYSYYLEGWRRVPDPEDIVFLSSDIAYLSGYKPDRTPDWSAFAKGTQTRFRLPEAGHYTFHVRARDQDGNISPFEANIPFFWVPPQHRFFLPAITKAE